MFRPGQGGEGRREGWGGEMGGLGRGDGRVGEGRFGRREGTLPFQKGVGTGNVAPSRSLRKIRERIQW